MNNERKPKVLVSAYACEPDKGSEPGVGWNWAKQIAKFAEVWVVTRANNREVIEEELRKNPEPNMHFVYVDLPKWMRFWKKGQKGVRLYYYLWQFTAYFKTRKLVKEIKFDIAHHVTFVNDWMPTFIALLHIPFVWGPIGSHPSFPSLFQPNIKSFILEIARVLTQNIFRFINPLFYLTLINAKKIIPINRYISKKYPFFLVSKDKYIAQLAIAVDLKQSINNAPVINYQNATVPKLDREIHNKLDVPIKSEHNNTYLFNPQNDVKKWKDCKVISVGRLIYIKGFHLAIRSFLEAHKRNPTMTFKIVGEGVERKNLEKIALSENLSNKILFLGNISRDDVIKEMENSDIFLFPSFEGGGMVVLEAMAAGLPVVCLDYGGPGEMVTDECGIKVKPVTPDQTIKELSDALLKLANDHELRKRMGEAGRRRVEEHYTWEKKGEFIKQVYEEVLGYKL